VLDPVVVLHDLLHLLLDRIVLPVVEGPKAALDLFPPHVIIEHLIDGHALSISVHHVVASGQNDRRLLDLHPEVPGQGRRNVVIIHATPAEVPLDLVNAVVDVFHDEGPVLLVGRPEGSVVANPSRVESLLDVHHVVLLGHVR